MESLKTAPMSNSKTMGKDTNNKQYQETKVLTSCSSSRDLSHTHMSNFLPKTVETLYKKKIFLEM